MNKVGSLPSGRVLLSQALKRYYEPLRLPRRPSAISVSLIRLGCGVCPSTAVGLPSCTVSLPPHAIPATPEDPEGGRSFESLRQRPSPSDHRVGISKASNEATSRFACATSCGFARGKLQPRMTPTRLPGARKVYEQLLSRDFNPLDTPPMTAGGQVACFIL